MNIDRRAAELAYKLLLGREPENEAVIENATAEFQDLNQLRDAFMRSSEFRTSVAHMLHFDRPQWILKEMPGNLFVPLDLGDKGVSLPILWNSEWEPETTNLLLSRLQADHVFVDIGANVGWFTILAGDRLRRLGGTGQVIAFEAQPEITSRLQLAVWLSALQERIDVRLAAISDVAGVVSIRHNAEGNRGGAYIAAVSSDSSQVTVPCLTLDDALRGVDRVDIIKMDIEGSELRALQGGVEVLRRFGPDLIIEINEDMLRLVSDCHIQDLVGFLSGLGYTCVAHCGEGKRPEGLSLDEIQAIVARETYPNFLFEITPAQIPLR